MSLSLGVYHLVRARVDISVNKFVTKVSLQECVVHSPRNHKKPSSLKLIVIFLQEPIRPTHKIGYSAPEGLEISIGFAE